MDRLDSLVERLEREDLFRILKKGVPEATESEVKYICERYRGMPLADRVALKSQIGPKAAWVILTVASKMAQSAIQLRKPEAVDQGILAFDISNIAQRDWRDAVEPAGRLALAAKECGVDIVGRAKALIDDIAPQILSMFEHPKEPRVTRDSAGNLVFSSAETRSPDDSR